MDFSKIYSTHFENSFKALKNDSLPQLFIIVGDTSKLKLSIFLSYLLDEDSFLKNTGEKTFSKDWVKKCFKKLSDSEKPYVLSYAQYSYITTFINSSFFSDRAIFLIDNLRSLFPIRDNEFVADTQESDSKEVLLPIYQADQFCIEDAYYCSYKLPDASNGELVYVFSTQKKLSIGDDELHETLFIDPFSDTFSIDVLLDRLLSGKIDILDWRIKQNKKQPNSTSQLRRIEQIHSFLSEIGGSLYFSVEKAYTEEFKPSRKLTLLLRKYWGKGASFRDISIYKNPDVTNEIVEISQGQIVQTVLDEYENVTNNKDFRDIFLTAPTGSGKSLLFQLPAFYIAGKGDVTIVISPLIALMKDQVNAIVGERGFKRVAYLNSEISFIDRDAIIESCKKGEIDILYMAPELLLSYNINYFIGERRIGLIVIDEAHLVTTWGRDFRVDYWYIGAHINKIRKYSTHNFPIIALTATAVYGGDKNDMVFDTVDSLYLHNPHYYIGRVKRDNIKFIVGNYDPDVKDFDRAKINQTVEFVKAVAQMKVKTLVYAPYTNQVRKIMTLANGDEKIAVEYYGGRLDPLSKEQAEKDFRLGRKKVMVCTKAFGMGVDIPDIQIVYHHAPSGLLPDYIQEIGRVARTKEIEGYAVINYSLKDQKYSKLLYGMSSLKLYQLRAVLKKVYETYVNNGKKRNMLLSVDDFSFAFNESDDYDSKVKTALMMIEKDYLAKYRYNVLLARPKSLFTKVFALMTENDYSSFCDKYSCSSEVLSKRSDNSVVVKLDLDTIWSSYYSTTSFPLVKRNFYQGTLFKDIKASPVLRFEYIIANFNKLEDSLNLAIDSLKRFFVNKGATYFEKEDLIKDLQENFNERSAQQLASFVLSTYSGEANSLGKVEGDAFLQRRGTPRKYRIISTKYEYSFSQLMRIAGKLFSNDCLKASRYISKENSLPYTRLGSLLEILSIGSFEMQGGEAPMVFIRINDPEKIRFDSLNKDYRNSLYESTKEKHLVSNDIFNHFFTRSFTNEQRWDFIEDFFLGENNEELIRKYPGEDMKKINIIDVVRHEVVRVKKSRSSNSSSQGTVLYFPRSGTYHQKDHLTLKIGNKNVTKTVKDWIETAPLSLHDCIKRKMIYVNPDNVYKPLMNRIRRYYPDEYNKILGTNKLIQFHGYDTPVMAKSVMENQPVKFYRWWKLKENRDSVYLSKIEQIILFNKVNLEAPSLLSKDDKELLMSKRRS